MGLSYLKVTPFGLHKIKKRFVDQNWRSQSLEYLCRSSLQLVSEENDSLVIKVTRRDENNFDMSFTDFANKMLNGLTTDYAAYEVIQKYKKFVMTQFFK